MWALLQVTIPTGGGPIQFSTKQTLCRQIIIQNNSADAMRIGDSTVSATNGINLDPGGDSLNSGPTVVYNSDLRDFWAFGTAADVLDIFYNQ